MLTQEFSWQQFLCLACSFSDIILFIYIQKSAVKPKIQRHPWCLYLSTKDTTSTMTVRTATKLCRPLWASTKRRQRANLPSMLKDLQLTPGAPRPIATRLQQASALTPQQLTVMDPQPMTTLPCKVRDLLPTALTLSPSAPAQLPTAMDLNPSTSWLQPTGWDLKLTVLGKNICLQNSILVQICPTTSHWKQWQNSPPFPHKVSL